LFGLYDSAFGALTWGNIVMLLIAGLLIYLGIARKMEPLLLVPIGFGVLLINLPMGGLMEFADGEPVGLLARVFRGGITTELIPAFIFLGLGALTDFGPLISNPKTLILGAGAQFGVFFAFIVALLIGNAFPDFLEIGIEEAAAIGIIGGADGPTTVFLTNKLAPDLIGVTAVAAYTYMALVPIILPPIIRLLTTKEERAIYMKPLMKKVSKRQKLLFPIIAAIIIILLVPRSAPLVGMFMFGNLLAVSGVTDRLADTAANAFMNVLTIMLGLSVGAFMSADTFLRLDSLAVLGLGVVAFATSTAAGILLAKLMNVFFKEKINPMIGAAGLSAVPMASRVVQRMGQQANPRNFLLMHAMGPNIAGVIGTAVAAGVFLGILG